MASEFARLEAIFAEALGRPTPEDRAAYIEEACGGDPPLRARVDALLSAHHASGDFLPLPEVQSTVSAPLAEGPGATIGRYKLLEQIGEGGFGVVFMAEQRSPVRRTVALKIIKLGMDTKQVVARFEAERQALAMMDHPNIAKVLDAGATDTGRPYFVMDLVRGVPITEFCDANKLTLHERLDLFVAVCSALQHAHQKGIIHRDLKPTNVLVTRHDDKAVPKIIDFGIAKAINQRLTEHTLFTEFRQLVGTPAYMSPEQAQMSGLDVDTRSDIYSLGVLLYELLSGTTPFDPKTLRDAGYAEMQRVIREVEPPPPSTRLATLAAGAQDALADRRRCNAANLSQTLRGDLDWIIMRCLEKDRSRRYETANGLARDIARYLADEPVEASPPSPIYKLRKLLRKHRRQVIAVAAIMVALVLGIIGTSIGLAQAQHNLTAAHDAENRLRIEKDTATASAVRARESEQRETAQRQQTERIAAVAENARKTAELNLADALIAQGDALAAIEKWPAAEGRYRQAMELLKAQKQSPFPAEVALWDANRRSPGPLLEIAAHKGQVNHLRFLPDGRQIATVGEDGTCHIWDTLTGRSVRTIANLGDVQRLSISPDGQFIAFASTTRGATLWRIADGRLVRAIHSVPGNVSAICFSPNASQLLIGAVNAPYDLYLVNSESGELIRTLKGHLASIRDVAYSPDGRRAASCDGRPPGDKVGYDLNLNLSMWDVENGAQLWHREADLNTRLTGALAWSPDGGILACTCWDGAAKLCDSATGLDQLFIESERGHDVQGVAFSSDGLLAVGGPAGSIKMLKTTTNDAPSAFGTWLGNHPMVELRRFGGHVGETRTVDFSPDGQVLASGGGDGVVRLWPVSGGAESRVFSDLPDWNIDEIFSVALSSDRRFALSSGDQDRLVRLWDVASGTEINSIGTLSGHQPSAAFGPGDKTIVMVEQDGRIGEWDNQLRERLHVIDPPPHRRFVSLALSADGRMLLAYFEDGSDLVVIDLAGKRPMAHLTLGDEPTGRPVRDDRRVRFSPDGSFAVGCDKMANVVKIWNTTDWSERCVIAVPRPTRVAVSSDSRSVACVGADVRVFDAQSGALTHHFDEAVDQLSAAVFLHDPRYLVTEGASEDGLVLWDLANDVRVRSIGRGNFNFDLACSADGTLLWSQRLSRASSLGALNVAHLDWVRTNDALNANVQKLQYKLEKDPEDREALLALGNWYAFRGMDDWAAALLGRAGQRATLGAADAALLDSCRRNLNASLAEPSPDRRTMLAKVMLERIDRDTEALSKAPADDQLLTKRGREYAILGRFKEACADLNAAVDKNPANQYHWHQATALLLQIGDTDGFQRRRGQELQRFAATRDDDDAHRVVKDACMTPLDGEQLQLAVSLADRAVAADHANWASCQTKGMIEYRSGHFREAIPWLIRSKSGVPNSLLKAIDELFLTMSYCRLGQTRLARLEFERAEQLMLRFPRAGERDMDGGLIQDWIFCHLVHHEAQVLLAAGDPTTRPAHGGSAPRVLELSGPPVTLTLAPAAVFAGIRGQRR